MPLTTDLNVSPYFDDYDENKNYYKILFRPSTAIQARELNQLQTILQKQIERHGKHIFKEGTIVLGGEFDYENKVSYVKAPSSSIQPAANTSVLDYYVGKKFTGAASGVTGNIKTYTYDSDDDTYVFFVGYDNVVGSYETFLDGENIAFTDPTYNFTASASNSTGFGSMFSVGQGVIFTKGFFVAFPSGKTVVSKYSIDPDATIGLKISESIVNENIDETLTDNALGSPNENAPGAHRLQISTELSVLGYNEGNDDPNFSLFLRLKNGQIQTTNERTQYARLREEMAKRTYDESGDYYVKGLNVRTREHLDTGSNEGLYTASNGGDTNKISIDIDPGVAYVKGREVNVNTTEHVVTDKGTEFEQENNQILNARTGGYVLINEITGTPNLTNVSVVSLYSLPSNSITSVNTTGQGSLLGTAKVKFVDYESGVLGTPSAQLKLYLFDIQCDSFQNVKSVYSSSDNFLADIVLEDGKAVIKEQNISSLIFPIGTNHIRDVSDISFIFNRTKNIDFSVGTGNIVQATFTENTVGSNETLAYSPGPLTTDEKRELFLTITSEFQFQLPGTVSGVAGQNTLTGTSFSNLSVGDRIRVNSNQDYYISNIDSDTQITLTTNLSDNVSGNIFRQFLIGDNIDLNSNGSSGSPRTAIAYSNGNVEIDLKENTSETFSGNISAKISYRVNVSLAPESSKTLVPNVFVKIDCNALALSGELLTDPINLGVADVYKIRSIKRSTTPFTDANYQTNGSNVTNQFTFDNGQRDNFYDHAKIRPTGLTLTTNDYLLIELDYFNPNFTETLGFFSADSYPVDDIMEETNELFDTIIRTYEIPKYVSSFGTQYDLRGCLDFRPIKVPTAALSTTVDNDTNNPPNPATTDVFKSTSGGIRIPSSDTRINLDYSYYLSRIDLVSLDENGIFNLIKGDAAKTPITPSISDNVMGLVSVFITPYPSITETLSRQLDVNVIPCVSNRIASVRHTMKDIGVLKNRIENLEYYNLLTLLEKSAFDLKIVDENGLDRFKNGFFVDGFIDHSLGATRNPDYKIAINKDEGCIKPHFRFDSFYYDWNQSGSSGVTKTGNLITLPYTETVLVDQPNVTTIRNIEQSVFRYIGNIDLTPKNDVWIDTTTVDKTIEFGNELPNEIILSTEDGSWETVSAGYDLYYRRKGQGLESFGTTGLRASYSSYAEATNPYNRISGGKVRRAFLETIEEQQRTSLATTLAFEKQTEELGNFVLDTSFITYIRPQSIRVYARGLRAGAKFYTFFDGEDMTDYVTPMVIPEAGVNSATEYLSEGAEWRADAYGELLGYLRLPADGKRFTVGTKEIIVTDSPTNAIDPTTYAKTYFLAQGLSVQKQNTILSTQVPVIQTEEITEQRTLQKVELLSGTCMAYTFKVDVDRNQEGVFMTSVDVYIKEKSPNLGIWFEIREMNSGGGITRTQVPLSEKWYTSDEITLSSDGYTSPHKVVFPSPVFLYNNTQYAFVIHTEGINPDYYFWVSRLGETDVQTQQPVTSRALKGTLYTTNNNLNYDMVPDVDLKCTFYRASFTTGSNGLAKFGNKPTEFLNLKSGASSFRRFGERIIGSDILTATSALGISIGDTIKGRTSGAEGKVVNIDNSLYYVDGFGFDKGETADKLVNGIPDNINYIVIGENENSIQKGLGVLRSYKSDYNEVQTLTGNASGDAGQTTITGNETNFTILEVGDVIKVDSNFYTVNSITNDLSITIDEALSTTFISKTVYRTVENYMIIDDSNGNFFDNGRIKGENSGSTGIIRAFDNFKYSSSLVKPHYLNFRNTSINFTKRGYNAASSSYDPYQPGFADKTTSFSNELMLLSKYDEDNTIGGSSSQLDSTLSTTTEFLSPVINLDKINAIYIHNLINDDFTEEDGVSGGNLLNRYISKTVTLADGQDAEDLFIGLSSFKPPGSDVKVWMKIRNNEDVESLDQKPWILLDYNENLFSSAANPLNYVDLEFTIPSTYKNDSTGVVEYVSNSNTFSGFKQFAIKIGLMGTNSALVPKVADLRVIALQM